MVWISYTEVQYLFWQSQISSMLSVQSTLLTNINQREYILYKYWKKCTVFQSLSIYIKFCSFWSMFWEHLERVFWVSPSIWVKKIGEQFYKMLISGSLWFVCLLVLRGLSDINIVSLLTFAFLRIYPFRKCHKTFCTISCDILVFEWSWQLASSSPIHSY